MIASSSPGRVRLRKPGLTGPAAEKVAGRLRIMPGVKKVETNPRTGSVLVHFDTGMIEISTLTSEVKEFLPESKETRPEVSPKPPLSRRALAKRGMALSLGGAVAALLVSEKMHVALGCAFLLFAGAHISQNRRTLLRR